MSKKSVSKDNKSTNKARDILWYELSGRQAKIAKFVALSSISILLLASLFIAGHNIGYKEGLKDSRKGKTGQVGTLAIPGTVKAVSDKSIEVFPAKGDLEVFEIDGRTTITKRNKETKKVESVKLDSISQGAKVTIYVSRDQSNKAVRILIRD